MTINAVNKTMAVGVGGVLEHLPTDTIGPAISGFNATDSLQFPNGDAGLSHTDANLLALIAAVTATDAEEGAVSVSNNLATLLDPMPAGDHTIIWTASDSVPNTTTEETVLTVSEAAAQAAGSAYLAFSDLISGPATGLNDGLGSGTIVTVWGQNLGSTQDTSTITFTDSLSVERPVEHIYYWKNADGVLPGGPANLFASHKMQEIAFSIPVSAPGLGVITVTVNGVSSTLPFTVATTGTIYWVHPTGNNSNPGTFASPKEYINGDINSGILGGIGDSFLSAGDIVYSNGVSEPILGGSGRDVGMYIRSTNGTKDNPISFVAYPGTRAEVISPNQGMVPYLSSYLNLSKFYMTSGHVDPALPPDAGISNLSDYHIKITKGRYVGNYLGQNAGTSMTGWSGAITNQDDGAEDARIYGNEIADTGSPNTSRFQHTLYISVRNESYTLLEGPKLEYNYLHGNFPNNGIHLYDETYNGDCGVMLGDLVVKNNVITDQWGAGINIETGDHSGVSNICWAPDIHVENNILINVGLGEPLESNVTPKTTAVRIKGDIGSTLINVKNNTLYTWGGATGIIENGNSAALDIDHHPSVSPVINVQNNIFYSDDDMPFILGTATIAASDNNLFFTSVANPTNATIPAWTGNILTDPLITQTGDQISIGAGSDVIDAGFSNPSNTRDIYGKQRAVIDVGATEF